MDRINFPSNIEPFKKVVNKKSNVRSRNATATKGSFKPIYEGEDNEINSTTLSNIINTNPFLIIQEFESGENLAYNQMDKEALKIEGRKLISYLRDIQQGILDEEFDRDQLKNIKEALEKKKHGFLDKDSKDLYEEISTRLQVELAKLDLLF